MSILLPSSPYSVGADLCSVSSLPYGLAEPIDTGQDPQPGLSLLQSALLGDTKRSFSPAAHSARVPPVGKPPGTMGGASSPAVTNNNISLRSDVAQTSPSPPSYKVPSPHAGKVPSPRSKGRQPNAAASLTNNQVLTKRSDGFAVPTVRHI